MIKYVAGFMFDIEMKYVALIFKSKPELLKGKWNGIGGKIEPGELPLEAMVREFEEETGVQQLSWDYVCDLEDVERKWNVRFYRCFVNRTILQSVRTAEAEKVTIQRLMSLPPNIVPNLRYLLPLALRSDGDTISMEIGINTRGVKS